MIRFDGHSILIADPDSAYGLQLSDALSFHGARCFTAEHIAAAKMLLTRYDFDMVISNYYLADGIIHQLIDWCGRNVAIMPIFSCVGYPFPADHAISRTHSIAEVFSKNDSRKILSSISDLLSSPAEVTAAYTENFAPHEILLELHVGGKTHLIRPVEITEESLFLQLDIPCPKGSFGVLKFSLISNGQTQNYLIPGMLETPFPGGQIFVINRKYLRNWGKFLKFINLKQLRITNFLNKAAGL